MSRQTARDGLKTFLDTGLPNVGTVYRSWPTVIPGPAFTDGLIPGSGGGAVIVIFIAGEIESRIAIGGEHSGWKRIDYTIQLHIFHRWTSDNSEAAMDDFDVLVEDTKTLLRSDRTAGGTFWEEGEKVLTGSYGDPKLQRGAVETWGELMFTATEMIPS